jgi:hypothetical protein
MKDRAVVEAVVDVREEVRDGLRRFRRIELDGEGTVVGRDFDDGVSHDREPT